MHVWVDMPAVRPGRLADGLAGRDLSDHVRELRTHLRGARVEPLADGVRLVLQLDLPAIAALADLVRGEADSMPFFAFRLLADPPVCWLEVRGAERAGEIARAVFGALAD